MLGGNASGLGVVTVVDAAGNGHSRRARSAGQISPPPLTWTDDRLEVLIILVEAYEQDHHPIGLPDPIEAIKARMEDLGLQRDDLCILLGVDRGLAKDTGWP
jgi:hypothetical protein